MVAAIALSAYEAAFTSNRNGILLWHLRELQ
jgi:hypothetical protein